LLRSRLLFSSQCSRLEAAMLATHQMLVIFPRERAKV
jgi:hypothetical protein